MWALPGLRTEHLYYLLTLLILGSPREQMSAATRINAVLGIQCVVYMYEHTHSPRVWDKG